MRKRHNSAFSLASLKRIVAIADWRVYPDGATVLAPDQYDGTETYLVADGALRASATVGGGEMRIEDFPTGAVFGAAAALADAAEPPRGLTVAAVGRTTLAVLSAEEFRDTLARHVGAAMALLDDFAGRLAESKDGLARRAQPKGPDARIFTELLAVAQTDPTSLGGWRIVRMPKHKELAERAGAAEAGAAAAVARLIQEGVAKRDYPGLEILDYERLTVMAQLG
ncbi:MAG: cyclic nucleotide-binding domain-containing protein [Pseudomonadota bacterium]